jgi:hypothetical protein
MEDGGAGRNVYSAPMHLRDRVSALRLAMQQLGAIGERQAQILEQQAQLREAIAKLSATVEAESSSMRETLRAIAEDEPSSRLRLWAVRDDPDYERPFEESDPLVTILIPTYANAVDLETRSIPSVLAQTHANLEIIVVGDAAGPEIEDVVRSFADSRLRYENLTIRGPYPEDPVAQWLVAGTNPVNEGLRLASGSWIGLNADDDALAPNHVEVLLDAARRRRLEIVYGRFRQIDPDGGEVVYGTFPPRAGQFGVQAMLVHGGLRTFPRELLVFGDPGDWAWLRRMIRLGARVGMIDDVVVDYYPSNMWGGPDRPPGTLDGWHP